MSQPWTVLLQSTLLSARDRLRSGVDDSQLHGQDGGRGGPFRRSSPISLSDRSYILYRCHGPRSKISAVSICSKSGDVLLPPLERVFGFTR